MINFKTLCWGTALVLATWTWGQPEPTGQLAEARSRSTNNIPVVAIQTLPLEAQDTIKLINQGGPFPYRKDGSIFGNREKLLPAAARGTYREYTVPTPGARTRGARRIITSQRLKYYTPDHYRSFQRVQE